MPLTKINSLLPIPEGSATSVHPSDILTADEQKAAIEWEIKLKQQHKRRQLSRYITDGQIEAVIKSTNWLQEINADEVLQAAANRKQWEKEDEQARNQRKANELAERQKIVNEWTYSRFYNEIKAYFQKINADKAPDHRFVVNNLVKIICLFFANSPAFESTGDNFSFNKGLLIMGDCGLGKTRTIEAIKDNPLYPVNIYSMIAIAEKIKQDGEFNPPMHKMIMLDDAGREPSPVNFYGTQINWFKDFIQKYYLQFKSYSGLIVTTNLDGKFIEAKYGYDIRSRIKEMFNVIDLSGPDMR